MESIQNKPIKGKKMHDSTFTSKLIQRSAQLVTDRFIRENERQLITSISRSQAWKLGSLNKKGSFQKESNSETVQFVGVYLKFSNGLKIVHNVGLMHDF